MISSTFRTVLIKAHHYLEVQTSWCKLIMVFVYFLLNLLALSSASNISQEDNRRIARFIDHDRPCHFMLAPEDRFTTTPEVIEKHGYPSERHWTTTEDGYILELHRIPAPRKHVVFILHGIFGSSRDFVVNCDRRALAFKLHDAGYDVWLGNYRGNTYCRNHTTFKDTDAKFWDFTVDQVSYYDGPAMIDYALNVTGKDQLSFIGHSMGNGIALIMLSRRPEYNDKVNVWFVLAAAVDVTDTKSPPLRLAAPFYRQIERVLVRYNHGEFLPGWIVRFVRNAVARLCVREGHQNNPYGVCARVLYLFDGYDPAQIPPAALTVLLGGAPTTMSAKFTTHWFQWVMNGRFALFDEGPVRNMEKYGNIKSPLYPIENLNTDVYLFWAENDWIITKESVAKTMPLITHYPHLRDKVHFIRVNFAQFNHLDFVHGKDADIYVYNPLMEILRNYDTDSEQTTEFNEEAVMDVVNNQISHD